MITEQQRPTIRIELYEIFDKFEKLDTRKEKVELLQRFKVSPLTDYLRCVFDPKIEFNLPGGKPPYTPSNEGNFPSSWHRQNTKLQYFVKGLKGDNMNPIKREVMFIQLLETVHPRDAELIADMANKKTPVKGLTKKIVQEAFPNLISE